MDGIRQTKEFNEAIETLKKDDDCESIVFSDSENSETDEDSESDESTSEILPCKISAKSKEPLQEPNSKTAPKNKILCIPASDIAALTGNHKYVSQRDAVTDYITRFIHPDSSMARKCRTESDELHKRAVEVCKMKNIDLEKLIEDITPTTVTPHVCREIISKLPIDTDPIVIQHIRMCAGKRHGIVAESYAIKLYEEKSGNKVIKQQEYKSVTIEAEECEFEIRGRIDGMIDGDMIIEIKNRQNQIFKNIPKHELLQVMVYMHMWNAPYGIIVQHHRGKIHETRVKHNPELMFEVLETLSEAILKFNLKI